MKMGPRVWEDLGCDGGSMGGKDRSQIFVKGPDGSEET